MRIVIGVATADAALRAFVSSKRDLIVPPEAIEKGYWRDAGVRFVPQIFAIDKESTSVALGLWLARQAPNADGLILLIDQDYRYLALDYEDAYFTVSLREPHGKIIQNYIRSEIAPILRNFAAYSQRFDTLNFRRILLLPLDSFRAVELQLLRERMTRENMKPGFGQDIDEIIAVLRRRSRPKSRSRFRTVYLIDDRPLWFRYGPEQHAIVQTVVPPHHDKCWHNSAYRFGRAYNPRLHHNVDNDCHPTSVTGEFTSCHGQNFTANGQSHLNVFPNGYI